MNVLQQPFYSTDVLTSLVRSAEKAFHALAERLSPPVVPALISLPAPPGAGSEGGSEDEQAGAGAGASEEEASMLARTRAALSCWERLKGSESVGLKDLPESRTAETESPLAKRAKTADAS
jgi:hypothetical protein